MAIMHTSLEDAMSQMSFRTGKEYIVYEALRDNLSDEYHVFNSVSMSTDCIFDNEADFIIFHPKKGVVVIEAKSGQNIRYENGCFKYSNGVVMDPIGQVKRIKHRLKSHVERKFGEGFLGRCAITHGLCFHQMDENSIDRINLPRSIERQQIMSADGLMNPERFLDILYNQIPYNTDLTEDEANAFINFIDPIAEFKSTKSGRKKIADFIFKKFTREQSLVLDFLEEQKSVAVNGAAGTGKTFVALERAERCAERGERVLFLCFNTRLSEYLQQTQNPNPDYIEIKNIHRFALDKKAYMDGDYGCVDFNKLSNILWDEVSRGEFRYKHIIIDEGQDFGKKDFEKPEFLQALKDIMEYVEGTFYIFYDKNQIVQSDDLPKCVWETDSKITLYRNCRNTMNISTCSAKVIEKLKPSGLEFEEQFEPIISYAADSAESKAMLDLMIDSIKENVGSDIVILTCLPENKKGNSVLSPYIGGDKYRNCPFMSVNVFKGLEADAVIMVDVNKSHFMDESARRTFYTGTSRAKLALGCICNLSDEDCIAVFDSLDNDRYKRTNRPVKYLFADNYNFAWFKGV